MNKKLTWGVVAIIIVVVGYNLLQSKSTPATGEPITIGVMTALTGDAAAYGEPARNILLIAQDEINNSGGIGGKPMHLIIEDSKCSGVGAVNAAQKLINVDKVKVIIGGFCSSESLAAVPLATQAKVALFSPGSSSPDLTNSSPYFFRNYPSDASQGRVLAEAAYAKGWKKVAFIQESLDYPLGIYKVFKSTFEGLGGVIVREEFPTTATDFRSQITKLRAQNPDALFIDTQTPAVGARIFKQMQDLQWKPAMLISDSISGDTTVVADNAAFLEGTLAAEFGTDPNNLKFQHLLSVYKEKYGVDVPYQSYAQTEYDAVYMVRDAIASVGNDGTAVAAWARSVKDWKGASGTVLIGQDGDRVGGHVLKVVKDGKVVIAK